MASASAALNSAAPRTAWKLDPVHTTVEFSAKHMMITTVRGRIADVEGMIYIDETNPANSSVEATLRPASIDTATAQRDEHLRSADFLNVERFPEITFLSTRIEGGREQFRVIGDLTIRGTTHEIILDVIFEGRQKDPWGGERVGFTATGKLDRRDFGLTWNQALEAGGVLVGNDIKLRIDAQATKEQ